MLMSWAMWRTPRRTVEDRSEEEWCLQRVLNAVYDIMAVSEACKTDGAKRCAWCVCVCQYTGWQALEIAIESGACDAVLPCSLCTDIATQDSEQSKSQVKYEVPSGHTVQNEGERRRFMMTVG